MLRVENLSIERGGRILLDKISLNVPIGEAVSLVGPNGIGKTTLLRCLAGLLQPHAGHILWQGTDLTTDPVLRSAQTAFVSPSDAIKPTLSVRANLTLLLAPSRYQEADHALERFGLLDLARQPARTLSTGQRRRLALARVSCLPGSLLLLDEPTLGLDAHALHVLGTWLAERLIAGTAILAATHAPLPLATVQSVRLGR